MWWQGNIDLSHGESIREEGVTLMEATQPRLGQHRSQQHYIEPHGWCFAGALRDTDFAMRFVVVLCTCVCVMHYKVEAAEGNLSPQGKLVKIDEEFFQLSANTPIINDALKDLKTIEKARVCDKS